MTKLQVQLLQLQGQVGRLRHQSLVFFDGRRHLVDPQDGQFLLKLLNLRRPVLDGKAFQVAARLIDLSNGVSKEELLLVDVSDLSVQLVDPQPGGVHLQLLLNDGRPLGLKLRL